MTNTLKKEEHHVLMNKKHLFTEEESRFLEEALKTARDLRLRGWTNAESIKTKVRNLTQ